MQQSIIRDGMLASIIMLCGIGLVMQPMSSQWNVVPELPASLSWIWLSNNCPVLPGWGLVGNGGQSAPLALRRESNEGSFIAPPVLLCWSLLSAVLLFDYHLPGQTKVSHGNVVSQ